MAENQVCAVCGEPEDPSNSSICSNCGQPFHLNPRNDQPGKDCGAVWINDYGIKRVFAAAGQTRPDDETESERRAKQAERLRALVRFGHIADIRPRGRDVAARQTVDDSRGEQHGQAARNSEHREAHDCAEQAEDQHRPASPSIGQDAQGRCGKQLGEGKRCEKKTDDER